jgi:hypothetical protein
MKRVVSVLPLERVRRGDALPPLIRVKKVRRVRRVRRVMFILPCGLSIPHHSHTWA